MRIIGGKFRGKLISPPANFEARPTTDFAKEALFNILNNIYNFENLEILDLFSGTGGISYEFFSRGASKITAVEANPNHANFITKQFGILNADQANIIKIDAFKFLSKCKRKFDIIFADPPYEISNICEIHRLVFENSLLNEDSLLIIEHSGENNFNSFANFKEERKYGSVHFSFFES